MFGFPKAIRLGGAIKAFGDTTMYGSYEYLRVFEKCLVFTGEYLGKNGYGLLKISFAIGSFPALSDKSDLKATSCGFPGSLLLQAMLVMREDARADHSIRGNMPEGHPFFWCQLGGRITDGRDLLQHQGRLKPFE